MLLWNQFYIPYTLTPFGTNDKVAIWSSSDTDIAEVDANGVVTEKKTGTVKITATLRTGLKKSFTLHIINISETPLNETGELKAAKSSVTLKEGQYTQIAVTLTPLPCDPSLYYSSSNESVAEVDSIGVIHAVKEGTAIITVTSSNDKTAKYKVIVKSSKKANTLKVTKKTKSIKAKGTVTVKTTSVKLGKKKISVKKFKFTKKGKLTVNKGKYKTGTYKIKVKISQRATQTISKQSILKLCDTK